MPLWARTPSLLLMKIVTERSETKPAGFQMDASVSEGTFQAEFSDSSVSGVAVMPDRANRASNTMNELHFVEMKSSSSKSIIVEEQTL